MKAGRTALLALILSLGVGQSHAQISGDARDAFTRSFKASCLIAQKTNAANQSVSDNLLRQYCGCNAAYFADHISADELSASAAAAAKGVRPDWFANHAQAASSYCSADLSKYSSIGA